MAARLHCFGESDHSCKVAEPFGFAPSKHPPINAWLQRITALPGWKHPYDLMPGNPAVRAAKEDA